MGEALKPCLGCQEIHQLRRERGWAGYSQEGVVGEPLAPNHTHWGSCNIAFPQPACFQESAPLNHGGVTASWGTGMVSLGRTGWALLSSPFPPFSLQCAPENTLPTPMVLQR